MLQKVMSSPIAWIVLSLLTLFSAVFAVYTWVASKKKKRISCSCKTNIIVLNGAKKIANLKVLYSDREIPNLFISHVYIWNSGNEVLNREDIVSARPLCIKCQNNSSILDASIVRENEPANQFSISKADCNSVVLDFDYCDVYDGVLVQVTYTGNYSDLIFDCKVKGGKPVLFFDNEDKNHKSESIRAVRIVNEWIIPLGMPLVAGILSGGVLQMLKKAGLSDGGFIGIGALLITILVTILILIIVNMKRYLRKKCGIEVPKSLLNNK